MCVSSRSSLVLFLTGTISSIVLAYKYNDITYLNCAMISLMQLSEWFMWVDIESQGKYKTLNILANYIGIVSLFLQTSFMNILKPTKYSHYLLLVNIMAHIILTYNYVRKHNLSKKEKSNKLSWGLMKANNITFLTIYTILFVVSQTFIYIVHSNIEYTLLSISLLLFSMKATTPFVTDFGSIWCYMGAVCVVIYTFYKLIVI